MRKIASFQTLFLVTAVLTFSSNSWVYAGGNQSTDRAAPARESRNVYPQDAIDVAVHWWSQQIAAQSGQETTFESARISFLSNLRLELNRVYKKGTEILLEVRTEPEGFLAGIWDCTSNRESILLPELIKMTVDHDRVTVNDEVIWQEGHESVRQPSVSHRSSQPYRAVRSNEPARAGFQLSNLPVVKVDAPGYHVNNQVHLNQGNLEIDKHKRTSDLFGNTNIRDHRESIGRSGVSAYDYRSHKDVLSSRSDMKSSSIGRHGMTSEHKTTTSDFGGFYKTKEDSGYKLTSKGLEVYDKSQVNIAGHKMSGGYDFTIPAPNVSKAAHTVSKGVSSTVHQAEKGVNKGVSSLTHSIEHSARKETRQISHATHQGAKAVKSLFGGHHKKH